MFRNQKGQRVDKGISRHICCQCTYIDKRIFPAKYIDDAIHVAVTSLNNIGILLSWNFSHMVKVKTRRMVALVNAEKSLLPVEIISPPEL